MGIEPTFFALPGELRDWFEQYHETEQELWVGFYKVNSGQASITWPESVDQALCFGWIDGVRKSIDNLSYMIRFTPRKPQSTWSNVNIKRVEELTELGLMQSMGLKAYRARDHKRSGIYLYEQDSDGTLASAYEAQLKANEKAWDFFQSRSPSYKRSAIWWVMGAKQEKTQLKRLATLIECSELGRTIPPLTRP